MSTRPTRKGTTRRKTASKGAVRAKVARVSRKPVRAKGNGRAAKIDVRALVATVSRQEKQLRELMDRQAIIDCTTRFCRGVNRLDKELLLSVFHPDAIDDHGFFVGDRNAFLDWIDSVYTGLSRTQHFVTNYTIEIEGDNAHVESYWFVANVGKDEVSVTLRGGRYVDRFERRKGIWAIAARVCLIEWNGLTNEVRIPAEVLEKLAESGMCSKNRNDLSYQRPLTIQRKAASSNPHTQLRR